MVSPSHLAWLQKLQLLLQEDLALRLVGNSDDLDFLLLAFLISLAAVEHGLHYFCFSVEDLIILQLTERNMTETWKCNFSLVNTFGMEWRRTVPNPRDEHCDVGSTTTELKSLSSGKPLQDKELSIIRNSSQMLLYLTDRFLSLYTPWISDKGHLYTKTENLRAESTARTYFGRQCKLSNNSNLTSSARDVSIFHRSKLSFFTCFTGLPKSVVQVVGEGE